MYKTNFFFAAIIFCALYGVALAQIKPHQGASATVCELALSFHVFRESANLSTYSLNLLFLVIADVNSVPCDSENRSWQTMRDDGSSLKIL
jgi:hypothetical protein